MKRRGTKGLGLKEWVGRQLMKVGEKRLKVFLNAFFLVVITGGSSVVVALPTFLAFRLFQVPVLFWRILLANIAGQVVWAAIAFVVPFTLQVFSSLRKRSAGGTPFQAYLAMVIGIVAGAVAAFLIGNWAGVVSFLVLAPLLVLWSKLSTKGKPAKGSRGSLDPQEARSVQEACSVITEVNELLVQIDETQDLQLISKAKEMKTQCRKAVRTLTRLRESSPDLVTIDVIAFAYKNLGGITLYTKEYSEAWDLYDRARELALQSDNVVEVVTAINNMGLIAHLQGDDEVALEYYREAKRYCDQLPSNSELHPLDWLDNNIRRSERRLKEKQ